MRGYPQFSFWISIALDKIYISCKIISRGKNTFELVGTVLNQWSQVAKITEVVRNVAHIIGGKFNHNFISIVIGSCTSDIKTTLPTCHVKYHGRFV